MRDKPDSPFERLVADACEGRASSDDLAKLQHALKDPKRMAWYLDYIQLDCDLSDPSILARLAPTQATKRPKKFVLWPIVAAAVAVLAFGVLYLNKPPDVDGGSPATASISDNKPEPAFWFGPADGARWHGEIERGDLALRPGRSMRLAKGVATIENKVCKVVIQGPASFRVIDERAIHLDYGRALARVSSLGKGFTVRTDQHEIVDLGTIFGVNHQPMNEKTKVSVFQGRVQIHGPNANGLTLQADERWVWDKGKARKHNVKPDDYLWEVVNRDGIAAIGGAVRALYPASPNVRERVSKRIVSLVRERQAWELSENVALDASIKNETLEEAGRLVSGRRIDSFTIAYAPLSEDAQYVSGIVRFQQPIVGMIWETDKLRATDPEVRVQWPTDRLERPIGVDQGDHVTLIDPYTIQIRMSTRYVDELRVLTEAGAE